MAKAQRRLEFCLDGTRQSQPKDVDRSITLAPIDPLEITPTIAPVDDQAVSTVLDMIDPITDPNRRMSARGLALVGFDRPEFDRPRPIGLSRSRHRKDSDRDEQQNPAAMPSRQQRLQRLDQGSEAANPAPIASKFALPGRASTV